MALKLIRPSSEYAGQVMTFKAEMLAGHDTLDGCAGLEEAGSYEEWADFENRLRRKYGDGYVPSEVFLGVCDGRLVGIIDYRHPLSPFLLRYGGNIGYSVRPSERRKGYAGEMLRRMLDVCREYAAKYARLWQTMKPETAVEEAILKNGIGRFAICSESKSGFDYWIAGLYRGGEIPEGLELYSFPASEWAVFATKGAMPDSLQTLNTYVWREWLPTEGKKRRADAAATLEAYSAGDPQSPDYECGIWVPLN